MRTQTWAMIVDAYRELCASKLFWLTLILSGLVVGIFAMLGINESGLTILWFSVPIDTFNTKLINEETFYKLVFQGLGIGIWLTWVAAILALITTAGFFPNLIAAGAIETKLSRPIGRARLFLTRYFTGLLFVALQVAVFAVLSLVVLGLRAGYWEPRLLLAIPIVIVFFSYLYCISVLVGMLTKSAIAAILLTVVFWFCLFLVNQTDVILVGFREDKASTVETRAARLERLDAATRTGVIEMKKQELGEEAAAAYEPTEEELRAAELPIIKRERAAQVADEKTLKSLVFWTDLVYGVKTVLPKTAETTGLLERWMMAPDEFDRLREADERRAAGRELDDDEEIRSTGPNEEQITEVLRKRSVWWIVGTSLIFEAVIVGWAMLVFIRRDY